MKYALFLSLIVFFSGAIKAQELSLSCQNQDLLFAKQKLSFDPENVNVNADYSEATEKNNFYLTGDVSLISDKYYLGADEITVNKSNKTARAVGNVEFQDQNVMFLGSNAIIKKQDGLIHTDIDDVTYHYPESNMNGSADSAIGNTNEMVFDSPTYTVCPLGNSDWRMKASKITFDSVNNRGTALHATVEFLGVPIMYLPYHSWVLEGRGSGFLSPSYSSYTDSSVNNDTNFQVQIPYYFNIAPDRDFLLTLNQLSSRGSAVEGKYRQLLPTDSGLDNGRFEIETHYLNNDKITNNRRWLIDSMIDLQLNPKTKLSIGINRVSDANYFKEIAHSDTSPSALNSYIGLSYYDPDSKLKFNALNETEQLLSGTNSYVKQPEFSVSKEISAEEDRSIELSLTSVKFAHKDSTKTTGIRTHTEANFSKSIITNSHSLTPSLDLMYTDYSLDNTSDQSRTIASFGLDSKLFLEREVNLFNTDSVQTLTPRIAYHYTPKINQSSLPNFDSADKDDSYYGLFSNQKFTGLDRISDANSFTVGLDSNFISDKSGNTYLSLKAAQTYHMEDQGMNSTGNFVDRRKYSDIAASVDLNINKFSLNNSLQFDPEKNQISKRDSSINYYINPRKFLTFAHHDNNGSLSAELYGSYPITPQVHVFSGINHSISDSITNKKTLGIAYESCCWAVRFAHWKNSSGDQFNKLELVLKGLASTSKTMADRLEEDIPNYLADLDDL